MNKYKCPECKGKLVQMLERTPIWVTENSKVVDGSFKGDDIRHYGFWCKQCKQMYKQKWEFIKDA